GTRRTVDRRRQERRRRQRRRGGGRECRRIAIARAFDGDGTITAAATIATATVVIGCTTTATPTGRAPTGNRRRGGGACRGASFAATWRGRPDGRAWPHRRRSG